MKIAVLICGNLRTTKYPALFDAYNQFLFEPNKEHSIDTFISLWNNTGERTENEDGITDTEIDGREIAKIFRPTVLEIKNYLNFRPTLVEKTQKIYKARDAQVAAGKLKEGIRQNRILANLSMWYQWFQVEELKNQYKIGTGRNYDVVFRLRADFVFLRPFVIEKFDYLLTPPWPDRLENIEAPEVYYDGINDWWSLGPENLMTKMNSLYENYDNMFGLLSKNLEPFINPHKLPVQNCLQLGVPPRKIQKDSLQTGDMGYILSRTTSERDL